MPNASLSEAIKEAYAFAPVGQIVLDTLEITHRNFTQPLYVVRDLIDFEAKLETGEAVTFIPVDFRFTLPEVGEGALPEIQIEIDNVSRDVVSAIEATQNTVEPVIVKYRPYLSSDTTTPQMIPPLTLQVKSAKVRVETVTLMAGVLNLANLKFPAAVYPPADYPDLL